MLIRHDSTYGVEDDAGAQAALDTLPIARPKITEQFIERRSLGTLRHHARRIDIDDRRRRSRHRIGKALHDNRRAGRSRGHAVRGSSDLSQERGLPPYHEESHRQANHDGLDQETHEDASVLQLISLLEP